MSLYLKHRPKLFTEIIGNRNIVTALQKMVADKETCPHVFLFHGPSGCGKTTFARILASELGCTERGTIEIDTAQFRGIDTVRDIRKDASFATLGGGVKLYTVDEVHKMTGDAQNAFLKILEDTPKSVYFALCTTDPQSLLPTVKGRCQQFQVSLLEDDEMEKLIKRVTKAEGETLEDEVLEQIIQDGMGQPRNALQILERVLNTPKKRRLEAAKQSAVEKSESIALCRALISNKGWKTIAPILKGLKGQDAEGIRRHVLGYAVSVLLDKDSPRAGVILECFEEPTYNIGFPGIVLSCVRVINYE